MKKLILTAVLIGYGFCLAEDYKEAEKIEENKRTPNIYIIEDSELSKYTAGFFWNEYRFENTRVILWDDYQKIRVKKDN